jgi:hypothetical protein
MRCIYLRSGNLCWSHSPARSSAPIPGCVFGEALGPLAQNFFMHAALIKPRPSADHSDRFWSNSESILPKVSCRVTLKWVGSNSRLFHLGLPCSTRLRHRATLQWGRACDDHLTGKTRVKMKPKATKAKERRHANELTLVEQRRGRLWTYAQVPVCATLVLCLLRLVQ